MAFTGNVIGSPVTQTVNIVTDLSAKNGYAVNLSATVEDQVALASDATKPPYPLIEGLDGSVTAKLGTIAVGGEVQVKLGGTVAPGDRLTSDGNGKWVKTVTDKQNYGAIAMKVGDANDLIPATVERGLISL